MTPWRFPLTRPLAIAGVAVACALPAVSDAWVLTGFGTNNPRRVFMMIGNGAAALWQNNATINTVSVSVPAAQVGNNVAQVMTSNSTQSVSPYDNYRLCSPPGQIYIGAAYQRRIASDPGSATLQVTSPANLTNANGDTIPFTEISWTAVSVAADANPEAIPSGTFNGATQLLTTVTQGTMRETCHVFRFANTAIRPSGTYQGRVTYTLFTP